MKEQTACKSKRVREGQLLYVVVGRRAEYSEMYVAGVYPTYGAADLAAKVLNNVWPDGYFSTHVSNFHFAN